jgi:hypothetical protein
MAMSTAVFDVTPWSLVRHERFGGTQSVIYSEDGGSILFLPKHYYRSTRPHGITSQTTVIFKIMYMLTIVLAKMCVDLIFRTQLALHTEYFVSHTTTEWNHRIRKMIYFIQCIWYSTGHAMLYVVLVSPLRALNVASNSRGRCTEIQCHKFSVQEQVYETRRLNRDIPGTSGGPSDSGQHNCGASYL